MNDIPKYIKIKCKRLEKLCNEAETIQLEIEKWAASKGADTFSTNWNEYVREICVNPHSIYIDSMLEAINHTGIFEEE